MHSSNADAHGHWPQEHDSGRKLSLKNGSSSQTLVKTHEIPRKLVQNKTTAIKANKLNHIEANTQFRHAPPTFSNATDRILRKHQTTSMNITETHHTGRSTDRTPKTHRNQELDQPTSHPHQYTSFYATAKNLKYNPSHPTLGTTFKPVSDNDSNRTIFKLINFVKK